MIVEILKTDKHVGVKRGQIYEAKRYWLDPMEKVTLIRRLNKRTRKPIGKPPECNQYFYNIKVIS